MAKAATPAPTPVLRRTLPGVDAMFFLVACIIVIGAIAAYGLR